MCACVRACTRVSKWEEETGEVISGIFRESVWSAATKPKTFHTSSLPSSSTETPTAHRLTHKQRGGKTRQVPYPRPTPRCRLDSNHAILAQAGSVTETTNKGGLL